MSKILIADDEPEVTQLCIVILKKENHTLISVTNGEEIIDTLKKEKPDLLILDVMLPGIDGYTLQLQIAQDPVLCKIPVVIISALKPAEKLFSQFEQVKGFISKPFHMDDLLHAVRNALHPSANDK